MDGAMNAKRSLAMEGEKRSRQRLLLAGILVITVFVAFIDRLNVSVLMADKAFLTDMNLAGDTVRLGLIMTVFLVVYSLSQIVLSPIGDYLGPRKAMIISLIGWEISLVMGGLAPYFAFLILSRVVLGAFESLHWSMQSTFVKNWFPLNERGMANAAWAAGTSIAPAVCMPLIATVVYYLGWRASFFVLATIGIVPLILLWFFTADTPRQSERVNPLELAYIEGGLDPESQKEAALNQSPYRENIKAILTNSRFWLVTAFFAIHSSVYYGILSWLPSYLKVARGFSWAAMGIWASAPFWMIAFCKVACGYLCDKTGKRAIYLLIAMVGAGLGLYFTVSCRNNLTAMIFLTLGCGLIGFATPATFTLLQDVVPRRAISAGAGVLSGVGNGVAAAAPVTVGYIISLTGDYGSGLLYLGCLTVIGVVISLILMRAGR